MTYKHAQSGDCRCHGLTLINIHNKQPKCETFIFLLHIVYGIVIDETGLQDSGSQLKRKNEPANQFVQ